MVLTKVVYYGILPLDFKALNARSRKGVWMVKWRVETTWDGRLRVVEFARPTDLAVWLDVMEPEGMVSVIRENREVYLGDWYEAASFAREYNDGPA